MGGSMEGRCLGILGKHCPDYVTDVAYSAGKNLSRFPGKTSAQKDVTWKHSWFSFFKSELLGFLPISPPVPPTHYGRPAKIYLASGRGGGGLRFPVNFGPQRRRRRTSKRGKTWAKSVLTFLALPRNPIHKCFLWHAAGGPPSLPRKCLCYGSWDTSSFVQSRGRGEALF